jgi:hypothetical protein
MGRRESLFFELGYKGLPEISYRISFDYDTIIERKSVDEEYDITRSTRRLSLIYEIHPKRQAIM